MITPPGGVPDQPEDTILIQIGFDYGLNYEFVVGSSTAVTQIFSYLPQGIAHGIGSADSAVVMQRMEPYDTSGTLGYITTLAKAYIPQNMVDQLQLELVNPRSDLYNHPKPSVKTLMGMIDPTIPLLASDSLTGPGDGTNTGGPEGDPDDPPIGGDDPAAPVRPSSIGIGVGVVAGAAVYGAAMFLVARRYKKRRSLHRRSSSLMDTSDPRYMTGGYRDTPTPPGEQGRDSRNSGRTGGSGRTYISPPVMAENSLGWN